MSGTYGNRPWDRRAEQYRLERQEALGRRGVVFGAPGPFVTRTVTGPVFAAGERIDILALRVTRLDPQTVISV